MLFIYKGTYVIHRDTISVEWILFEKSTRDIRLTPEDFWLVKGQNYHHIETSQLIYTANQLTGFYMVATLVSWFNLLIKEPECFVVIIVNLEQIIILSCFRHRFWLWSMKLLSYFIIMKIYVLLPFFQFSLVYVPWWQILTRKIHWYQI